ncbi:MAG: DUF61 family protein [Nitrososphaerota archaeon]
MSSDYYEEWLRRQLKHLTSNTPRFKLRLEELLQMENPYVELISGEKHYFDRRELEELRNILPGELASRLKLPLVFKRSLESSESLYYIDGGLDEVEAVKKIVGLSFIPSDRSRFYTYKPVILSILSKFSSIVLISVV